MFHGSICVQLRSWYYQEGSLNFHARIWMQPINVFNKTWAVSFAFDMLNLHILYIGRVTHAKSTMIFFFFPMREMMRLIQKHLIKLNFSVEPFFIVKFLHGWFMVVFFPLASSIIIKSSYRPVLTSERSFSRDQWLRETSVNQKLIKAFTYAINHKAVHESYMLESTKSQML